MLRNNREQLPIIFVQGGVVPAIFFRAGMLGIDGVVHECVTAGGITLNAKVGDLCNIWAADHLEPGVSTKNPDEKANSGYNALACIGNEATVITGDAKGAKGFVTGKHGGAEHVMIYFDRNVLEKLNDDDKFQVRAQGLGMQLLDYPSVALRNLSPELLEKMNIEEKGGKLHIGVAKIIPQCILGSGIGDQSTATGDYDITMHDPHMVEKYDLNSLRLGDIIAITDVDGRFGRTYMTDGVMIGVVVHSNSSMSGHGPGVTTLMACLNGVIEPILDERANLATYFIK